MRQPSEPDTYHVTRNGAVIAHGHLAGDLVHKFLRTEHQPGDRITATGHRPATYTIRPTRNQHAQWRKRSGRELRRVA